MPRAPSICTTPGCPAVATADGRCQEHQREAWQGSTRRVTLPKNWQAIRAKVLKRDGYLCQIRDPDAGCLLRATEVDHVGSRDDHRLSQLRAACSPCHQRRSAQQGQAARAALAARGTRPAERHPGLIS